MFKGVFKDNTNVYERPINKCDFLKSKTAFRCLIFPL